MHCHCLWSKSNITSRAFNTYSQGFYINLIFISTTSHHSKSNSFMIIQESWLVWNLLIWKCEIVISWLSLVEIKFSKKVSLVPDSASEFNLDHETERFRKWLVYTTTISDLGLILKEIKILIDHEVTWGHLRSFKVIGRPLKVKIKNI